MDKIKELFEKIRHAELTNQQKMILVLIGSSFLILLVGSIVIISQTIASVDGQDKKIKLKKFKTESDTIIKKIEENIEIYNYEGLKGELDSLDTDFKNYDKELEETDKLITDFTLPISSPIVQDYPEVGNGMHD